VQYDGYANPTTALQEFLDAKQCEKSGIPLDHLVEPSTVKVVTRLTGSTLADLHCHVGHYCAHVRCRTDDVELKTRFGGKTTARQLTNRLVEKCRSIVEPEARCACDGRSLTKYEMLQSVQFFSVFPSQQRIYLSA
jgi:hypothetical protein